MKLTNCPFCGSDNIDPNCGANDSHADYYFVFCNKCEACGPTEYDRAEAVRLWNERNEGEA